MLASTFAIGGLLLLYLVLYLYRRRGDALQDMITGLPSHDFFARYVQQCIARGARHPELGFAVLLLEIRGFDEVRRRLGRFGAEEILSDFAERVTLLIRPTDVIARVNDDEFAIVLDEVRRVTDATRVAVRVHESLTEAMTIAAQTVPVRLRTGVTLHMGGALADAETLLAEAETALERARASERTYVVFDAALDAESIESLSRESQLLASLDRGELHMGYSPLVTSDGGELAGFTALLQWQHPELGLIMARDFIQMAESSREILRIGAWAVAEACKALIALSEAGGPLLVTVNVSELELSRGDVATVVERALAGHPHLAMYLRIEIPSMALATVGPAMEATLARLRSLGVGVHLDQVATTGISLRRALQLDLDGVRISLASFGAEGDARLAVSRLVAACATFAREIVVESIEDAGAFAMVRSLGRPVFAQGYFFGAARSLDEAIALALPVQQQRDVD